MKRVIKDFGFLVLISQKPFLSSSRSPLAKSSRGGDSPLAATAVAARPCYHCIPAAMADCCNLHSIRWLMAAAPGLALQHFMSHVKGILCRQGFVSCACSRQRRLPSKRSPKTRMSTSSRLLRHSVPRSRTTTCNGCICLPCHCHFTNVAPFEPARHYELTAKGPFDEHGLGGIFGYFVVATAQCCFHGIALTWRLTGGGGGRASSE